MTKVAELIEYLGGPTAVARLLSISAASVCGWKEEGRISRGRVCELAIASGRPINSLDDARPENWHRIWPELGHIRAPTGVLPKEI